MQKKDFGENVQVQLCLGLCLGLCYGHCLGQKFSTSKIYLKGNFCFHDFSIKHDILRLFAKNFSWLKFSTSKFGLDCFGLCLGLFWTLSRTKNVFKSKFLFKGFFFHNFSIKHDILRLFFKRKILGENFLSPAFSLTLFWTLSRTFLDSV